MAAPADTDLPNSRLLVAARDPHLAAFEIDVAGDRGIRAYDPLPLDLLHDVAIRRCEDVRHLAEHARRGTARGGRGFAPANPPAALEPKHQLIEQNADPDQHEHTDI